MPCAILFHRKEDQLTVDRLSIEQDLSFADALLRNGDDVTISATLTAAPQRPESAHDCFRAVVELVGGAVFGN